MDTILVDLTETTPFLVAEVIEDKDEAQKKNAPEFAALGTFAVDCATTESKTNYTTEPDVCQINAIPTLDEIEAVIAEAARMRIVAAHRGMEDIRARIERETTARWVALTAAEERVSQTKSSLDGVADERIATERRAQAFLGEDELKSVLGKIHLAFNVRQLELEAALAEAEAHVSEAQPEIEAASVSDALELQLAEQELERLESAAPEVARALQQAAAVSQLIARARQALQNGMLRGAAAIVEQAKKANAEINGSIITRAQGVAEDPATAIDELERALADAQKAQIARDLVEHLNAIHERPGALKRIKQIEDEAATAGVVAQVASAAAQAKQAARRAANARFAKARPIADHLASEGFVPVVGDGRIEAWKRVARNGTSSQTSTGMVWTLGRILNLRSTGEWITETPRNPITQKELPMRVRHSRWFRSAEEHPLR